MATKKNQYKKHIKLFIDEMSNGYPIAIEKSGEYYIVCNSFMALKVHELTYELEIHTLNEMFELLADKQYIKYSWKSGKGKKKELYRYSEFNNTPIFDYWEKIQADKTVVFTNVFIEPDMTINRVVRIILIDNEVSCVNDKFVKAIVDYCNFDAFKTAGINQPIVWESLNGQVGCLLMPIRSAAVRKSINLIKNTKDIL